MLTSEARSLGAEKTCQAVLAQCRASGSRTELSLKAAETDTRSKAEPGNKVTEEE